MNRHALDHSPLRDPGWLAGEAIADWLIETAGRGYPAVMSEDRPLGAGRHAHELAARRLLDLAATDPARARRIAVELLASLDPATERGGL